MMFSFRALIRRIFAAQIQLCLHLAAFSPQRIGKQAQMRHIVSPPGLLYASDFAI
jgi:hypothetical protein